MAFKHITLEKKDYIGRITINRPEARNSLSVEGFGELAEAFHDVTYDNSVGVVVLTGAGDKAFTAGADVKGFKDKITRNPVEGLRFTSEFVRMGAEMRRCGKPIIARVFGDVVGGGVELMMYCDLVVAAENTRLLGGEAFVGAIPIVTTQMAPIVMGEKRAKWFLLTGDRIDARTAYEWGLVNKVVPFDKLDEEVDKLCQTLLHKFPWALGIAKTQLNFWQDLSSTVALQGCESWALHAGTVPELLEGASAFMDKRPTEWMKFRERAAEGRPAEYLWGAPVKNCPKCGAENLPESFEFCGRCGAAL